jgi:hypothetical protein
LELCGTPAAKLLTRVERQTFASSAPGIAHAELLRARREAEAAENAFKTFLDRACTVPPLPKLASFPQNTVTQASGRAFSPTNPALRL